MIKIVKMLSIILVSFMSENISIKGKEKEILICK